MNPAFKSFYLKKLIFFLVNLKFFFELPPIGPNLHRINTIFQESYHGLIKSFPFKSCSFFLAKTFLLFKLWSSAIMIFQIFHHPDYHFLDLIQFVSFKGGWCPVFIVGLCWCA